MVLANEERQPSPTAKCSLLAPCITRVSKVALVREEGVTDEPRGRLLSFPSITALWPRSLSRNAGLCQKCVGSLHTSVINGDGVWLCDCNTAFDWLTSVTSASDNNTKMAFWKQHEKLTNRPIYLFIFPSLVGHGLHPESVGSTVARQQEGPGFKSCVESACSPSARMDSLQELWIPPMVQKQDFQVHWYLKLLLVVNVAVPFYLPCDGMATCPGCTPPLTQWLLEIVAIGGETEEVMHPSGLVATEPACGGSVMIWGRYGCSGLGSATLRVQRKKSGDNLKLLNDPVIPSVNFSRIHWVKL
ncbi:uncharacterized protein LOC118563239 [Fundulus heteroclitus]|uniref:uncharacterized protein LOC118563239 n=1 Tax=Fundulus heteroclitus TaxID=8078 RepID=UPI00165AD011|nr:uncharacterized protein LOC118563239 [Fundulus heteroclitus]